MVYAGAEGGVINHVIILGFDTSAVISRIYK